MRRWYSLKKEIGYLLVSLLLGYMANFLFFGKEALNFSHTLDVNIYDTYYVFQNYAILFLPILGVMFLMYLIRVLKLGYGNTWVNLVFLLSILGIIISFDRLVSLVEVFATVNVKEESSYDFKPNELNRFFAYLSYVLKGIQLLFLGILILVSFKIGSAKKIPTT